MQLNQFIKSGVLILSLMTVAACSSTGEFEDGAASSGSTGDVVLPGPSGGAGSGGGTATTSPGSTPSSGLTQGEIRRNAAIEQTVFYFDFDMAEFQPQDRQALVFHARDLAANPAKRIRLEGHADERGTREYNLALGERRANSIMNFLIVNGASRSQIENVSYGEERPAADGQSEAVYARNRRVEIVER